MAQFYVKSNLSDHALNDLIEREARRGWKVNAIHYCPTGQADQPWGVVFEADPEQTRAWLEKQGVRVDDSGRFDCSKENPCGCSHTG